MCWFSLVRKTFLTSWRPPDFSFISKCYIVVFPQNTDSDEEWQDLLLLGTQVKPFFPLFLSKPRSSHWWTYDLIRRQTEGFPVRMTCSRSFTLHALSGFHGWCRNVQLFGLFITGPLWSFLPAGERRTGLVTSWQTHTSSWVWKSCQTKRF